MRSAGIWCAGIALLGFASVAGASLITFDEYHGGQVINNQYSASDGVTISADNFVPGHPDLACLFDTFRQNTADPDLQQPWTGGGNATATNFHKILIIPQDAIDNNHNGIIDNPNDEGGAQPAGIFMFKFRSPQEVFGLDLIDVDGPIEIGTNRDVIIFKSAGREFAHVSFGDFVNPSSKYYDPTVHYHDNSANHIQPIDVTELGIQNFDEVDVEMGWSSAIDNIYFQPDLSNIIPEPTSLMLLALPMVFMSRRRNELNPAFGPTDGTVCRCFRTNFRSSALHRRNRSHLRLSRSLLSRSHPHR